MSKPLTEKQWRVVQGRCWLCDWDRYDPSQPDKWNLETHEMLDGIHRKVGRVTPAAWIRACNVCHKGNGGLHDKGVWPLARQLALKKIHDFENYDRVLVNRVRCEAAPEAITEDEVDAWVKRLNEKG